MRINTTRSVSSVLALSILASTAGAAEPAPTLWSAASEAGSRPVPLAQATAAPAANSSLNDKSFFKTSVGKLTLALMAVGLTATIYSVHHDRKPVKSPIR